MRAVEGNLGLPLPILGKEEDKEKEHGLTIPCARATRGHGLPSLDARMLGNRQAALLIITGKREKRTLYFLASTPKGEPG
jgi:hypothetical protein